MAGDRRTKKTLKAIKDAMIQCLQDTSYENISVKQLCSTADINRSTFYFYYQGLSELYSELEEEFLQKVDKAMYEYYNKSTSLYSHLLSLVKCYGENSELFLSMVTSRNRAFYNALKTFIEKYHFLDASDEQEREFSMQYYLTGITGVVNYWIISGRKQSPEYVASLLEKYTR